MRTILIVIVHENDIRKITLPVKPQTVDSLLEQEKLGLHYKFSLQFEDPDFNNSLVNLTDIADSPDKPTLKIVSLMTTPTSSTADAKILSVASNYHSIIVNGLHDQKPLRSLLFLLTSNTGYVRQIYNTWNTKHIWKCLQSLSMRFLKNSQRPYRVSKINQTRIILRKLLLLW